MNIFDGVYFENIDKFVKKCVWALSLCYILGLILTGLYFSNLNILNIELFKPIYFLTGAIFLVYSYLILFLPTRINKIPYRILYLIAVISIVIVADERTASLIFIHLLGGADSPFSMGESAVKLSYSVIVLFAGYLFSSYICLELSKSEHQKNHLTNSVIFLITSFLLSTVFFLNAVLPNIPNAIGGRKPAIVRIGFSENAPFEVKYNFEIKNRNKNTYRYFAKIIHKNDKRLYMTNLSGNSLNEIHEIDSKFIDLIVYMGYNPHKFGITYTPYISKPN